jgi:dTDP-4-amino-4,6-dideoxygalactose transaminase
VEGLGVADGYPDSINGIDELKGLFAEAVVPGAKIIAERIVTLPIHPFVSERDLQRIVQVLRGKG